MSELYPNVVIIVPCTKKDDEIMQEQSSFQIITLDIEIEEHFLFKDEYMILSEELSSLLGCEEKYIYQLNFSSN